MHPTATRQQMACGYEPPVDGAQPWEHRGYDGPAATVCPGYVCKLPDVIEVSRIRAHWKVGALREACGGEQPTQQVMDAVLILDGESGAMESWTMRPAKEGGGRAD